MKKYLFGVFAIALAVAFSAFKAPTADVKLTFQDPGGAGTQLQRMQNPANWIENGSTPFFSCGDAGDEVICSITVDDDYVSSSTFVALITLDFSSSTVVTVKYDGTPIASDVDLANLSE